MYVPGAWILTWIPPEQPGMMSGFRSSGLTIPDSELFLWPRDVTEVATTMGLEDDVLPPVGLKQ